MAAHDIEQLVQDAKAGDPRAFEELVRQTYTDTYSLAYRLTGNEDDASDVVQETYLRAHKGIGLFRGDAQFTTWIHRITSNCANTFLGRRGKHRHDDLEESATVVDQHPSRDPEHRADVGDMRDQLTKALRSLPPKLRTVIVLRDIYDLSHLAIANELGITESAAKVRLHRGRKRLKEILQPAKDESPGDGAAPADVDGVLKEAGSPDAGTVDAARSSEEL